MFIGELGLDGSIRPVRGVLAMLLEGRKERIERFVVPAENAYEGSILSDVEVIGVSNLKDCIDHLNREIEITPVSFDKSIWENAPYAGGFF